MVTEYAKEIASIGISVGLMVLFIVSFYFTIAVNFEKKVVENEVIRLTSRYTNIYQCFPDDLKQDIKSKITDINIKNEANLDNEVIKNNNKLKTEAIIISLIIVIIFIGSSIFICNKYNLDTKSIFLNNLVVVLILGFIEFLFTRFAVYYYKPLDINTINSRILKLFSE